MATVLQFLAADNFNRANENPIGGNWTNVSNNIQLSSSAVAGTVGSSFNWAVWTSGSGGTTRNYKVQVTMSQKAHTGTFCGVGVIARAHTSGGLNGLYHSWEPQDTHFYLGRFINGGAPIEDDLGVGIVQDGDSLELIVSGNTWTASWNGTVLSQSVEPNFNNSMYFGSGGLHVYSAEKNTLDNFALFNMITEVTAAAALISRPTLSFNQAVIGSIR